MLQVFRGVSTDCVLGHFGDDFEAGLQIRQVLLLGLRGGGGGWWCYFDLQATLHSTTAASFYDGRRLNPTRTG